MALPHRHRHPIGKQSHNLNPSADLLYDRRTNEDGRERLAY